MNRIRWAAFLLLFFGNEASAESVANDWGGVTSPSVFVSTDWIQTAQDSDFETAYPKGAHGAGNVYLWCTLTDDGGLESCRVMDEDPKGVGFGEAALSLTHLYRAAPVKSAARDGSRPTVSFGIQFRHKGEPVTFQNCNPPFCSIVPAPTHFLVFFERGSCAISHDARVVLDEVALAAKERNATRLTVIGYADTSGSPEHNRRLSECRAQAVKAYLISKGIEDHMIATGSRGEGELQVQTGDGVREQLNRRVSIDLQR